MLPIKKNTPTYIVGYIIIILYIHYSLSMHISYLDNDNKLIRWVPTSTSSSLTLLGIQLYTIYSYTLYSEPGIATLLQKKIRGWPQMFANVCEINSHAKDDYSMRRKWKILFVESFPILFGANGWTLDEPYSDHIWQEKIISQTLANIRGHLRIFSQ